MDNPDGPMSRVGRTFWSVWTYISEAVNRFLRPEPSNTQSSDPIASQQSADSNEPVDSGHPEGDTHGRGVNEEQALVKASLLSSSRPVVAWESCTTEIDLGPAEESTEYKSQLCEGGEGKASEEGERLREEQFDKIRNDDVELLVAKDASTKGDKEEDGDWKLYSHGQSETPENHEHEEHAKVGPLNLADTVNEDIEGGGSKAGAEDKTQRALDDDQEMDETMRKIKIKEEDEKMHHEEEEDTAVMDNGAENSGGVLQVVLENENKYDKGAEQDKNVFSIDEELSDNDRDVEEDPSVAALEDDLQITFKERVRVSEDDGQTQVMAQSSESDEAEDEREKEDESTLDLKEQSKEENTSEVAHNQEVDEAPEQKEDIKTISENSRSLFAEDVDQFGQTKNDDVELNVAKDTSTKEEKEEDSDWKLYSHGQRETPENHEHDEHAKVRPLNLAEDTISEDIEGEASRAGAEDKTQRALDDDQEMDETMRKIQIKEEDDEMHHEDERDLDAKDTEVTLYTTTDFSLEDEQSMHTEESRQWRDEEDTAVMHNGAENSGGVLQVVLENENKYDKGAEQDKNVFSIDEELSDNDRDVEEDPSVAALEDDLQITFKKRVSVSEDDGQTQVMAQSSDEAEDEREKEDESTLDKKEQSKEENTSEVAHNQEVDEEPEQKEDIKTISENSRSLFAEDVDQFGQMKNDDVELIVAKDASTKEDKEEDSEWKLYSHGQSGTPENHEHEEHAKLGPLNLAEDTVSEDTERGGSRAGDEDKTQRALGDDQEMESGQSEEDNNDKIADNQEIDEEPEQEEEDIKTVSEVSHSIFTEDVRYNEEAAQNGEAKLHTVEIAHDEKEDVAEVGTKTRETDAVDGTEIVENSPATTADFLVGDRLYNEDRGGEERLSSEKQDVRESYMEIACTATSVTVKPIGETGQEIGGELKNTPPRICEGPVVVSQGLTSLTSEETQEGVPGYNNEPEPGENTTQRLLEVENGNGKEIHATLLPEEEESKEPESTQNSGTRGDYLTPREHMEELRENTDDIKKEQTGILHLTDTGLPQKTERLLVEPASEEPGHLFEGEEAKLLEISMKMGIGHLEKDFETHGGVTDETELTTTELRGVTEELLVEFETDEGLNDSRDSAGGSCETTQVVAAEDLVVGLTDEVKVQTMQESNFCQESADTMNFEQNSNKTHSFLEDVTESGFIKESVETEPKFLDDSTGEMHDAGIDMEEPGYGAEEEDVEDEMQNNKQMEFFYSEVAGMATDLTTENNATVLFGESELSSPDELLETKNLPSDEAFEVSKEEILTDNQAADTFLTTESRPKDMALISEGSYAEEIQSPVSGCQDVIEEELLDLWIQTALSKDNNDMEQQEESEPSQQMDTKMEQEPEEQHELPLVQVEEEKEQLVESSSGESGLLTDTEMSSSTAESGFLDQCVSEWGPSHSDTGLFQGSFDKLPSLSESADASELSEHQPRPESVEPGQSDLTGEDFIIETEFHHDSGARSSETEHQIQEVEKSQESTDEEQVESVVMKTESQEEIDADVMDLSKRADGEDAEGTVTEAEIESFLKDEETRVKDAPLEVSVSDSADEIKDAESEQSGSGSEASLQDDIMLMSSQEYAQTDSKKLLKSPSLDKDIPESPPELNRAEGAEQPTTEYENQMEVDGSALDFTPQRSRIAVKNPRVRPPKDPRSLLNMPSVDPTPSSRLPVHVPVGVPLGGMGIGIKLPGIGAGFPVLKKTQRGVREEKSSDTLSQEPETKLEETRDAPKQDEAPRRPKWMPPKQPGFGNPLMSELKSKLKKTTE